MCSAGLSVSKENWKAITAKRTWSAPANNGAKAWWSIMTTGTLTRSQTREAAAPRGNLEKSMEDGGGGKEKQHSGNSTHLNIMFIYSTTKEENVHCHCVCVCQGRLNVFTWHKLLFGSSVFNRKFCPTSHKTDQRNAGFRYVPVNPCHRLHVGVKTHLYHQKVVNVARGRFWELIHLNSGGDGGAELLAKVTTLRVGLFSWTLRFKEIAKHMRRQLCGCPGVASLR